MRRAPRACASGLAFLSLLVSTGCGMHYCARENALYRDAAKEFGTVQYKDCLRSRGWQRAQKLDPPPTGWYRGIEGDETVRLNPPPSQSPPSTR